MKYIFLILILLSSLQTKAQHYDANKMVSVVDYDDQAFNVLLSASDDRRDIIISPMASSPISMTSFNVCMSDSLGNLAFYTNGLRVVNANGISLIDGDSIMVLGTYCTSNFIRFYNFIGGLLGDRNLNALPLPGRVGEYIYLYPTHYTDQFDRYRTAINYAHIDMNCAEGRGCVIDKAVILQTEVSMVAATLHANGLDWWILLPDSRTNKICTYLLTSEGLVSVSEQHVGSFPNEESDFEITFDHHLRFGFSPDGNNVVSLKGHYMDLFGFDRCTGLITFEGSIPTIMNNTLINLSRSYIDGAVDCCFSSDSHKLYLNDGYSFWVYDLSQRVMSRLANTSLPRRAIGSFTILNHGVIYSMSRFDPGSNIYSFAGFITYPDRTGMLSEPVLTYYNTYPLPSPFKDFYPMPDVPNYRLGKIAGAIDCTAINIAQLQEKEFIEVQGTSYFKLLRRIK